MEWKVVEKLAVLEANLRGESELRKIVLIQRLRNFNYEIFKNRTEWNNWVHLNLCFIEKKTKRFH